MVFDNGLIIKNTYINPQKPVNSSTTFPTIEPPDDNSNTTPMDIQENPPHILPNNPQDHSDIDSEFYDSDYEFEEQGESERQAETQTNEQTNEQPKDINLASSSTPQRSTRERVPSQKFLEALTFTIEPFKSNAQPNSYQEAMMSDDSARWKVAMDDEYKSLMDNKTWTLIDLPKGRKPVGCRWVYKIKLKSDGTIDRFKARLVAKGYSQVEGLDFHDTFSPVVKITSIRVLLAWGAWRGLIVHQMDVKSAFLNGTLEELIYMLQPEH